jgi:hypothetical protein
MIQKRKQVYIHQKTGDLIQATRGQARKLSSDYKKVEFGVDENGKPKARVRMDGVTMDISERKADTPPALAEVTNGNTNTN